MEESSSANRGSETTESDDVVIVAETAPEVAQESVGNATLADKPMFRSDNDDGQQRVPFRFDSPERLVAFQYRNDSLRVSASNVAAMVGLHPYKNLAELLTQLVYQGPTGQALLRKDSRLLGLRLVSDEQILRDLANKAGPATKRALESALQVKQGEKVVANVDKALEVKRKVLQEAQKTGRLQVAELKLLGEGARSAVDTGFGTAGEDDALDWYAHKCGEDQSGRGRKRLSPRLSKTQQIK